MNIADRFLAARVWIATRVSLRGERGTTAVEYGIVAVCIAAVIVIAVSFLGASTNHNLDCGGRSIAAQTPQCP
jgi:Flp pilus assembly pilin Flp